MEYLPNGKIKELVKTETIKRLKNFRNHNLVNHLEDLSYFLFPVEYITNSYFGDNDKAKDFICDNFTEVSEILQQIESEIAINYKKEILTDIFKYADNLMVAIMIESANYLIMNCDIANGFLSMFLTDEKINEMIEEIKTF